MDSRPPADSSKSVKRAKPGESPDEPSAGPHGGPAGDGEIEAAARKTPFVVVDLEGTASMMVAYAISRADLVIIPTQGSQLDAAQAAKAIKLCIECRMDASMRCFLSNETLNFLFKQIGRAHV